MALPKIMLFHSNRKKFMKRNWILVSLLVIAAGCASHKHATHQGAEMSSSATSGRQTGTVTSSTVPSAAMPSTVTVVPVDPGRYYSASATLKQDMRKLWTDHVVWTRFYIVAALDDHPSATAAANRLMQNQEDIGRAIAKYYGEPTGQKLTVLLKEHISIATDVVKAAKANDKAALQEADNRWQQNALQISDFLSEANPYWSRTTLSQMMRMHLSTTTDEVTARLNNDWDADARAFEKVYDHILKMSDALSEGIVKQFPEKFGKPRVSPT
jgi:hypothetical protein